MNSEARNNDRKDVDCSDCHCIDDAQDMSQYVTMDKCVCRLNERFCSMR